jgi:hypothetical protein
MAKRILDTHDQQNGNSTGEIIDHLIHEMENQLQVISMEAHLRRISEREPRCVLDAAENIEKLLGKVREHFSLLR